MPGSIANASVPAVAGHPLVFPQYSYTSFVEGRAFAVRSAEYHDGTIERMNLVNTSRRSWQLGIRLAPVAAKALAAFLLAHKTDAMYWYNPKEPMSGHPEGSNYDATGASLTGRYTVRLAGDTVETIYMPRTEIPVQLVEIA